MIFILVPSTPLRMRGIIGVTSAMLVEPNGQFLVSMSSNVLKSRVFPARHKLLTSSLAWPIQVYLGGLELRPFVLPEKTDRRRSAAERSERGPVLWVPRQIDQLASACSRRRPCSSGITVGVPG